MPSRSRKNSREIIGVAIIAAALLTALSLFEAAGILGDYLQFGLMWTIGLGRFLLPVFLLAVGALFFTKDPADRLEVITIGFLVMLLSLIVGVHIGVPNEEAFVRENIWRYGGMVGAGFSALFERLVGQAGSYVIVFAAALGSTLFVTGASIREWAARSAKTAREGRAKKTTKTAKKKAKPDAAPRTRATVRRPEEDERTVELLKPADSRASKARDSGNAAADQLALVEPDEATDGYKLAPISLLKKSPAAKPTTAKDYKEQVKVLEQTLKDFDIHAKVEKVISGPTVMRFELQLPPGIKVNRVVGLADDIALALASADIRVLAPIPGKAAVGIEVPKTDREMVTIGDMLEGTDPRAGGPLAIPLGKDITGKPLIKSIADMPHMLIAGATGSGKSVCINSILMTILLRARPDQVKLVLVDPKRVELKLYDDIPHLLVPVVTEPKDAAKVLTWAVGEMGARYELLSQAKVRNIAGYNEQVKNGDDDREQLPFILIVIDELADLMMAAAGEVEDAIVRLSQMARAVGIHLVVATQRPSANVITGLIKANIPCRAAFAVSSQVDSRVVIDANGAEKLIGKGDMLYMSPETPKAQRLQAGFVAESEVQLVVDYVKKQAKPEYKREILSEHKPKVEVEFTDDLFDEALDLVVTAGQASTSSLQRRLRVGYARAARLMDIMEQRGLIGPADGSKPREILITREELEELRGIETTA